MDVIKRDQIHFIYQDAAHEKYRMNVIYGIQLEIWKCYGYTTIRESTMVTDDHLNVTIADYDCRYTRHKNQGHSRIN